MDPCRRLQRHGDPARIVESRPVDEAAHLVLRQRPHRLAGGHHTGERHVGVQPEGLPCLERLVLVSGARHHLHGRAAVAGEHDEPCLGADEAQSFLETRVAHVGSTRGERERGRHLLQPCHLVGAQGGLFLRPSPRELRDGETGLVSESPHDCDRGRIRVVDDGLPRDDEHEVCPAADHHGRAERRPNAELSHPREAVALRFEQNVGHEGRAEPLDRIREPREVGERDAQAGRPLLARGVAPHELQEAVVDPPEHPVVGTEGRTRLAADGGRHLFGRVRVEPRSHLQDPLERRSRLVLALVQACALERLSGESSDASLPARRCSSPIAFGRSNRNSATP